MDKSLISKYSGCSLVSNVIASHGFTIHDLERTGLIKGVSFSDPQLLYYVPATPAKRYLFHDIKDDKLYIKPYFQPHLVESCYLKLEPGFDHVPTSDPPQDHATNYSIFKDILCETYAHKGLVISVDNIDQTYAFCTVKPRKDNDQLEKAECLELANGTKEKFLALGYYPLFTVVDQKCRADGRRKHDLVQVDGMNHIHRAVGPRALFGFDGAWNIVALEDPELAVGLRSQILSRARGWIKNR